jgi:hypothetical protein
MDFMPFVRSFVAKAFKKDFNIIMNPPYAYKSIGSHCNAFVLLCVMPMLFITYRIFISMYLVTLH